MKTGLILLIIVLGGAAGYVYLADPAFFDTSKKGSQPTIQTWEVKGEADALMVDSNDPLLSAVSAKLSSVTAVPASVEADGQTSSTVVVTLRTDDGRPVAGAQVNLESSRGVQDAIEVVKGVTGGDGQAVFLVKSLQAGTAIFNAYAGTKLLDAKAVVKLIDAPVLQAGWQASLPWILSGGALLLLFQYLLARNILSTRRFEEEELYFHHAGRPVKLYTPPRSGK